MRGKVAKRLRAFAAVMGGATDYDARKMVKRVRVLETQGERAGLPTWKTIERWNLRLRPNCARAIYQRLKREYRA